MSFCTHCGAALEEGDHFCPGCGVSVHSEQAPPAAGRIKNQNAWPVAAICVGVGVIVSGGVLIGKLVGSGNEVATPTPKSQEPSPVPESTPAPAPEKNVEVIELPKAISEPAYREISYPEIPMIVRIPAEWVDNFDKKTKICRFTPPAGHPDADLVWTEVRPISNRRDLSKDEVAKALTESVSGLKDLKIDNFIPVETRPGGEVVKGETSDGDLTLHSVIMEIHYTDEKTGRPFRGHSIATSQSDDRGAYHYITLMRCDVDRWEAYTDVMTQFLGHLKIGIRPQ